MARDPADVASSATTTQAIGTPLLTRRRVITGGTMLGIGGAAVLLGRARTAVVPATITPTRSTSPPARATSEPAEDYGNRRAYDAAEATYRKVQAEQPKTSASPGGTLAWGESRALQSYLIMYKTTSDISYLDKLVEASQPVLAARDNQRGEVDYRGHSLPAWAAAEPYTVAGLDLNDEGGNPTIRLVAAATEPQVVVDVSPGTDGVFHLTVRGSSGVAETISGLTLDPAHSRYIVRILKAQYPGPAALTATDLRPVPRASSVDLAGLTNALMPAERYVFAVHTGMICTPWAQFAALVRGEPDLRRRYGRPADELLSAAEAAVQSHDADWRRLSSGTGIYTFATGAPVRADGTYLPHNQYLAVARCMALLYVATRDPQYRTQSTLMFNLFRSDLSPGPSPSWTYYWSGSQTYQGFGENVGSVHSPRMKPQRQMEDPSHGAVDLDALVSGHDAGLIAPTGLMSRLAATFFDYVVRQGPDGHWVTSKRFGSSETLSPGDLAGVRWIALARWDRRVYATVADMLDRIRPAPRQGDVLSAVAQMVALR